MATRWQQHAPQTGSTTHTPAAPGAGSHRHPLPRHFLWAGLLLLVIIGFLFRSSLHTSLVLFSNDGPLGMLAAQADNPLGGFTGYWQDLNWIGTVQPSALPTLTQALYLLIGPGIFGTYGPILFSKFYAPAALLFLGLSAWLCIRQFGFSNIVCILVAIAAALNTNTLSNACWGLPSRALTLGVAFLAVAAIKSGLIRHLFLKAALAGLALAVAIMEGFDAGALFSIYLGAFAFMAVLGHGLSNPSASTPPSEPATSGKSSLQAVATAALVVVVMAAFAAWFAAHAIGILVGTQIKGVEGMAQDEVSRSQRWDQATQWSLPKIETLRVIVPGLFGYRMDTTEGGNYWGAVGQTPGWTQHRSGLARHSGSGEYAGVFVVVVALWSLFLSFSSTPVFSRQERWHIRFWAGAALISLMLAWGRHFPLYQILYQLPYFSTMRNPIKFMHPFHLCLLMMFGFGLEGLRRRYLTGPAPQRSLFAHLNSWWKQAAGIDRKSGLGVAAAVGISLLLTLVYLASQSEIRQHLENTGFPSPLSQQIAAFSLRETAWSLFFLIATALLLLTTFSGWFKEHRLRWAWLLMGLILITDLVRANQPWIVYYDYKKKYALNPVLDFLRQDSHEHRVTGRFIPISPSPLAISKEAANLFSPVYNEWLQHHFQFYNIQSLDIAQMPRIPELDAMLLIHWNDPQKPELFVRRWELTNTRLLLGEAGMLATLNQQFDPQQQRFQILTNFSIRLQPGVPGGNVGVEDLTAAFDPNGPFAIFDFTGALPRAKFYSQWQVLTNNSEAVNQLKSPQFDPHHQLLINGPPASLPPPPLGGQTEQAAAEIQSYAPKEITVHIRTDQPGVLLLNDRYDPNWRVWVNGEEKPLLRCNLLMRGVHLQPGNHQVEFRFDPPVRTLWLSLAGLAAGCLAGAYLVTLRIRQPVEPVPLDSAKAESDPTR